MKYKVEKHEVKSTEFAVYELASNGEVCKRVAICREEKDANLISSLLNNTQAVKNNLGNRLVPCGVEA